MSALSRAILILAVPALAIDAQSSTQRRASTGLKAAQVIGGALAGSLVGFVAWKRLDDPFGPDRRVKGDAGYTPKANIGYAIGSFVGSTLAIQMIGRSDGSHAPIWATALGTGLGGLPMFLAYDEPYLPLVAPILLAPLQGGFGTIGYQRFRRQR